MSGAQLTLFDGNHERRSTRALLRNSRVALNSRLWKNKRRSWAPLFTADHSCCKILTQKSKTKCRVKKAFISYQGAQLALVKKRAALTEGLVKIDLFGCQIPKFWNFWARSSRSNQWQSAAIGSNRRQSAAIGGNRQQSACSFVHLLVRLLACLLVLSFVHLFVHSFVHLFVHSFVHLFVRSYTHSFLRELLTIQLC